jgi:hypothetical protein
MPVDDLDGVGASEAREERAAARLRHEAPGLQPQSRDREIRVVGTQHEHRSVRGGHRKHERAPEAIGIEAPRSAHASLRHACRAGVLVPPAVLIEQVHGARAVLRELVELPPIDAEPVSVDLDLAGRSHHDDVDAPLRAEAIGDAHARAIDAVGARGGLGASARRTPDDEKDDQGGA